MAVDKTAELPACWVVRAGPGAQDLELFCRLGFVGLDDSTGEVDAAAPLEVLTKRVVERNPGMNPGKAQGRAALLRTFVLGMTIGDVVLTPSLGGKTLLVGTVASSCRFVGGGKEGYRHVRDVEWRGEVDMSVIPEGVRRSLGAPTALYRPAAQRQLLEVLGAESLLGRLR